MSDDKDATHAAVLPEGASSGVATPRDVTAAVSVFSAEGSAYMVVVLRAGDPWLVPDTPVTRETLATAGIEIRPVEALRLERPARRWSADTAHWAQMVVAARDKDGIGWLVVAMKAGTVSLLTDDPAQRLSFLGANVPLVEGSVGPDGVTRVALSHG